MKKDPERVADDRGRGEVPRIERPVDDQDNYRNEDGEQRFNISEALRP